MKMNATYYAALAALLTVAIAYPVQADNTAGVVAGWDSNDGRLLLGELKCACLPRAGKNADYLADKQAPNLSQVGARVTPQYLRKLLANPRATKPGTTMPDLLHGMTEKQRGDAVEELTHYLATLGGPIDQRASGASLGEISHGRELFHTVGCVACHQPQDPPPKHKIDEAAADDEEAVQGAVGEAASGKRSVPLPPLAMKTTVDQLAAFLHDPLAVRASGRMPSLNLQPGEGRSIAAYLLREQYTKDQTAPGSGVGFAFYNGGHPAAASLTDAKPDFEGQLPQINLQQALKTVPTKDGKPPKSNFGVRFFGLLEVPADGAYRFWTKSDDGSIITINGQRVVDNDGQHPPTEKEGKIELRKGRHQFEVAFVQGGGGFELAVLWQPPGAKERSPIMGGVLLNQAAAMIPQGIVDFKVDPAKAERGRELFAKLGCAACHETGEKFEHLVKAMPMAQLNPALAHGCLSETPAGGLPKYDLNKKQIAAMREAFAVLKKGPPKETPAEHLHFVMNTMNCYACHQRGDIGGPEAAKADYFVYEKVVDLGDEGRLPPPLDDVGAKLTAEGFGDMMFAGQRYRTYMATRMPQFGKQNTGPLVYLFTKADEGKYPSHEPEFSPRLVDDGRFLMGNKALSCINCHAWGEHRLPGAEGMDLLASPRRLQPSWFHAWLKDPQAMRPGTRMPTAWPQGKSFFADIQGGKVDPQIDAIWAYLSVGEKGGFPPGLSPDDATQLVPSDEPIVFRTFLDKVSAHAILVGFRQRTHMAFDANRIRTVVAWTGPFINTKPVWDGRAGQYAQITSNDQVWLPDGPAFAALESDAAPWPVDKPKQRLGSNRTPEDWRFRGYRLDDARVPTFLYDIGELHVQETPGVEFLRDSAALTRTFRFAAKAAPEKLFFRAAAGKTIVEKGGVFHVDDKLRVRIASPSGVKPFVREVDGGQELLLPVKLVKRNDDQELTFTIEMMW